jgi:hypothetical protein
MAEPTQEAKDNASGLADFQKEQIEESNDYPKGSLGRGTGPVASSSGSSGNTGQTNPGQDQVVSQAIYNAAHIEYLREKLRLVDVPMMEIEKDRLAFQKAAQVTADALATRKFEQIDLPMLKLQQDQLAETRRQFDGELAMRGITQASQEATKRAEIGMMGMQQAEQLGLSRQELAQKGYLGAGGLEQQRRATAQAGFLGAEGLRGESYDFAQRGAQGLNETALAAMNLSAQLRGPRDAWVQQQVNRGLNAAGLSSDVGAIAGEYDAAGFQAPQATPQAASLGGLAQGMVGAGGQVGPGGQPTANEMIRAQMMSRMSDPYGEGGRAMMSQAYGMEADPFGAAGRAMMGQAGQLNADPYGEFGRQLGEAGAEQYQNQYTSPTQDLALRAAQNYYSRGNPVAPSINAAMASLRENPMYLGQGGEGRRAMEAAAVSDFTGLDPQAARAVIDRLRAVTAGTGRMSTDEEIEAVVRNLPGVTQQSWPGEPLPTPQTPAMKSYAPSINWGMAQLRANPAYQASDAQTRMQHEANAIARYTGLGPQQAMGVVTQLRSTGRMSTDQEIDAAINGARSQQPQAALPGAGDRAAGPMNFAQGGAFQAPQLDRRSAVAGLNRNPEGQPMAPAGWGTMWQQGQPAPATPWAYQTVPQRGAPGTPGAATPEQMMGAFGEGAFTAPAPRRRQLTGAAL